MTSVWIKFSAIIILAVFAGFVVFGALRLIGINKNFSFRLGLDLQGGTHLVYEGNLSEIPESDRDDAMSAVRDVIERRVNAFGVAEPVVQRSGDDRLIVELPGVKDVDAAVREIGLTPTLDFREENPEYETPDDPALIDPTQMFTPTGLSGKHLKRADIVFNQQTNEPQVTLQFNDEGRALFAQITERNLGRPLAIFLDGRPISAPIVQQQITAGEAVITGIGSLDEAKDLAQRLNAGALPVPISLLEQKNIGPTLGQQSVRNSIIAGIVGLFSVALFMIVYYRLPGLMAVLSLLIYTLLALTIFKLIPVTLTLAGIAGFILSIGMAIDANILIFERVREELRGGSPNARALSHGFSRAWTAIRDSNVSSLITVFILGYFGTSLIRGFAITLGIGILLSIFTAITVSRTFLQLIYGIENEEE